MENDQFRKKVYLQTHSSTLINPAPALLPEWVSENQINFTSAYEFSTYNIESQTVQLIPRHQNESQVLLVDFKREMNDIHNEMYYLYQEKESFFLVQQSQQDRRRILLYRRDVEQRSEMVEKFLDFIIKNQDERMCNSSLISKTQKLIEEIKDEEGEGRRAGMGMGEVEFEVQGITQMKVVYECNFVLLVVQMKKINGIMLVDIAKAQVEGERAFRCGFATVDLNRCEPQLGEQEGAGSRLIYVFPQKVKEIHRTKDITQFVILTENNILLAKVNYDQMELCVLSKLKIVGRLNSRVVAVRVNEAGEETYITGLMELSRPLSMKVLKEKKKRVIKLFKIQDRRIIQIPSQGNYQHCLKYENYQEKTLKFLDDPSEKSLNIKFSEKVVHSRYELSEEESQDHDRFNNNIIMNVFNSMLNQSGRTQQKILSEKEDKCKKLFFEDGGVQGEETMTKSRCERAIKDIGGFICNKNVIVLWEKDSSVLHLCKIVTIRELQERYQKDKEAVSNKTENRMQVKEKEMKDIYAQLMGSPVVQRQETVLNFQSRIEYVRRVQLQLPYGRINGLAASPNNYHLLIVSSNGVESKQSFSYSIFQLQLFSQLSNPDPNMFLKSIRYIYKNKPTQHIAASLVRELPIFLTGNLVHTSENELIEGALSFDVHPCHLFLAVSFGFTTKIYAFEGNQRLSSLHTINIQGIKQVKYNPMGNHLCLLASKSIKVIDCYSFAIKFVVHQKNSSFSKCFFSTNGQQLYTISENHHINIYNTFDYSRIDSFRVQGEVRPLAVKNYAKVMQYCIVMDNGGLMVRYGSEAVVVSHEMVYRYLDNEKIACIELDERNGILFVGCTSGKLRAHIWPLKEQQFFDQFSQIRIGFTPIQSMTLSNLHYNLYLGSASGNTSKVRYVIDRDRGPSEGSLFTEGNLKYVNMNGNSNVEKVYRFVLANGSSVNEQLPEKMRLQYKLSEVINKLNEEMHKLKTEIKEEIEEKIKMTSTRFDINLYHHLNRMITTKLSTQYLEEQDSNQREIEGLRQAQLKEMKRVMEEQKELVREKSMMISGNVAERNRVKEECQREMKALVEQQQKESEVIAKRVQDTQKRNNVQDEEIYYLPSHPYDYEQEISRLTRQLESESKFYYQLRKECTYKETAIKGMSSKKAKEESLQFKFDIETKQMTKKYEYNRDILSTLKRQIEEAEDKVHQMQTQASVIKTNAQFKKVANLDEMNDACSYKLWVKEKTEKEIHELCEYLREVEEFLEGKSGEMVELVFSKAEKTGQIKCLEGEVAERKEKLKDFKLQLLNSKNRIRRVDPHQQYKELKSTSARPNNPNPKTLQRMHSTRQLANKDVSLFNSIMDKQMNYLKTTMKIHSRKIRNFGKENGELLTEFEKLKYENKNLQEQREMSCKMLRGVRKEMKKEQGIVQNSKENVEITLVKTSFQKYLANKEKKRIGSSCRTAATTPTHLSTVCATPGLLSPRIYD